MDAEILTTFDGRVVLLDTLIEEAKAAARITDPDPSDEAVTRIFEKLLLGPRDR